MMFPSVLQVCAADISEDGAKTLATDIVAMGAHLDVLLIGEAAFPPVGTHVEAVSKPWLDDRERQRTQLLGKEEILRRWHEEVRLSCDVETVFAEAFRVDNSVGDRARFTDLIVVGSDIIDDRKTLNAVLDGALFHAHAPVLLIPAGRRIHPIERAAIAWSSAPETTAAVRSSIPLLQLAKEVVLVSVDPPSDFDMQMSRLTSYLSRHGISVKKVECIPSNGRTVVEAMDTYVEVAQVDLVVMGAYSHSKMLERILGGTTDSIIARPTGTVFMAR
ncbi:universal stress protein [Agrobacterium sp.]|uniref:universal stress protein n=1 Tax=Agrobacterium sp. TaxID=361 RepID=UPI0028AF1874|nr:universal stress protein [Agrobacterium sp.]